MAQLGFKKKETFQEASLIKGIRGYSNSMDRGGSPLNLYEHKGFIRHSINEYRFAASANKLEPF